MDIFERTIDAVRGNATSHDHLARLLRRTSTQRFALRLSAHPGRESSGSRSGDDWTAVNGIYGVIAFVLPFVALATQTFLSGGADFALSFVGMYIGGRFYKLFVVPAFLIGANAIRTY
jgi:hypothetical protein